MVRLCGRPGCSEVGAVAYGMVPEDLLFWISPINEAPTTDPSLLCERHADAMVVPRGWTLDDRREDTLRLFSTRHLPAAVTAPGRSKRRRRPAARAPRPEQMQIDGTGEIERPPVPDPVDPRAGDAPERPAVPDPVDLPAGDAPERSAVPDPVDLPAGDAPERSAVPDPVDLPAADAPEPWQPSFDADDDLDGLLEVESPLLARAFLGTDRRKR